MIYLTSDIHHQSLKTQNQLYSDKEETLCAREFLTELERMEIPITYFISGKCFDEQWSENLEYISSSNYIDLGGHNYDCFENEFYHRICNKVFRSYNGTYSYQMKDCIKTKAAIYKRTRKEISLWRNHMYMHGKYTDDVLSKNGIRICSDGVQKGRFVKRLFNNRLLNIPINIIPDHEHLYHAERTPDFVKKWVRRYNWSDDFGSQSYYVDQWANIVKEQLLRNELQGINSVVLIHPITMYLCDNYHSILKVLASFDSNKFKFLRELI